MTNWSVIACFAPDMETYARCMANGAFEQALRERKSKVDSVAEGMRIYKYHGGNQPEIARAIIDYRLSK